MDNIYFRTSPRARMWVGCYKQAVSFVKKNAPLSPSPRHNRVQRFPGHTFISYLLRAKHWVPGLFSPEA